VGGPLGALSNARPIRLPLRVDVQDDPRDLTPVGSFRLGVEHAHIGDGVLFVINGEHFTESAASATWRLRVGRTGALSRKN
jgi:hypothetical protein